MADHGKLTDQPPSADLNRAEQRQYVGAYFGVSGVLTTAAFFLQVCAVALATLPAARQLLGPAARWYVLGLALAAPLARSVGDASKRIADGILRRIELSDGLGRIIERLDVERLKEDASFVASWLAKRQQLDTAPYASQVAPGSRRLIANLEESAWWSARQARANARWNALWTVVFIAIPGGVLFQLASSTGGVVRPDVAEFAATLIVLVFAEGHYRRGQEFASFARESDSVAERASRMLRATTDPTCADALDVATTYFAARQASPRMSLLWYWYRRDALNAAWMRSRSDANERPL